MGLASSRYNPVKVSLAIVFFLTDMHLWMKWGKVAESVLRAGLLIGQVRKLNLFLDRLRV